MAHFGLYTLEESQLPAGPIQIYALLVFFLPLGPIWLTLLKIFTILTISSPLQDDSFWNR